MSSLCPYCAQAEIGKSKGKMLFADVAARGCGFARQFFEMQSNPSISIKEKLQGFVDPSTLPIANEHDRLCPYCRRGHVTRQARKSLWIDVVARVAGIMRLVVDANQSTESIPWYRLAMLAVDPDGPEIMEEDEALDPEIIDVGDGSVVDDHVHQYDFNTDNEGW